MKGLESKSVDLQASACEDTGKDPLLGVCGSQFPEKGKW